MLLEAPRAFSGDGGVGAAGGASDNVVGIGISRRRHAGALTNEPVIAVYLASDLPPEHVSEMVPLAFEAVPVEVVTSGRFTAQGERDRQRPVSSGISASHHLGGSGTLGFAARWGSQACIVSNNHVFALSNSAARGDHIMQPSPDDGGGDGDVIGELGPWVELDFAGGVNRVDAALACVDEALLSVDPKTVRLDVGSIEAVVGTEVKKTGRTTRTTRGVIVDASARVNVGYVHGTIALVDQVLVRGLDNRLFSDRGDSGSLVLDRGSSQPVGLLCGGSPAISIVNPIRHVLDDLGVSWMS